jgi:hypothetical protein
MECICTRNTTGTYFTLLFRYYLLQNKSHKIEEQKTSLYVRVSRANSNWNHKYNLSLGAELLADGLSDLVHVVISVDVGDFLVVVLQHRRGFAVELGQAGAQLVLGVVPTLDQGLAGDVIDAFHLGGIEEDVVCAATGRVDQATGDSFHQQLVVDVQVDHSVDANVLFLQQTIQNLCLVNSAGETIQNKSLGTCWATNSLCNNTSNNIIAHKLARVHNRLGLLAHFSSVLYRFTKHITGG